jgi:hypothetical protein
MRTAHYLFLILLTLCGYCLGGVPAKAMLFSAQSLDRVTPGVSPLLPVARKARKGRSKRKRPAAQAPAQPAATDTPPPPTRQPPPPPPPNVKLRAALATGGPALVEGIGWRVLEEKPAAGKPDKVVWSGGASEADFHLNPGRYYAEAAFGFAKSGQEIEVAQDGTVETTVVLNAGTINARGIPVAGGQPLTEDMFYVLRRTDEAGVPSAEVGRSSLPQAVFYVPAGTYRLALQHGLAKTEIPVVVMAGQAVTAEGVLNSGKLRLTASATENGAPLDDVVFFVHAEDNTGHPRELARSELRQAEFDLPAGRYKVAALYGLARVEREVTIKAGAVTEEKLVMDAGVVRMSSMLAGADRPLDKQLIYKVYAITPDQGASAQSVATSAKPTPTMYLKSGKYRIESQYGWHNARQTREVDVAAGQTTELVFEHKASEVKLKLVVGPGTPAPGRVKWTVKYANGGTVLISQDDAPSLILQAGSYQVVAQYGTKTYSRAFEANPNEVHTIELVVE